MPPHINFDKLSCCDKLYVVFWFVVGIIYTNAERICCGIFRSRNVKRIRVKNPIVLEYIEVTSS